MNESTYDIEVLKEMFRHMKVLSDGETSIQTAIHKIRAEAKRGGYLCVIVDPDISKGHGKSLIEEIRTVAASTVPSNGSEVHKETPIIAYQKRLTTKKREKLLKSGYYDVLPNPSTFSELRNIIDSILI
jgi:DNA-binding response OmpR family regulator